MTTCAKSHLFAKGDSLPDCLREATQTLTVTFVLGPSKGEVVTVHVCDPCAGMLTRTRGLHTSPKE